jgi:type VI secretion system secreted protein Hcp
MAEPAFVVLRANGRTIEAELREHDLEFAPRDAIELVDYSQAATVAFSGTGVTGKRSYEPISFRKRIDKASPLIARAFAQNQVVEADFHFFRQDETTGDVNEYFRVQVTRGTVVSFGELLDDTLDPAHASRPPLEEVGLLFQRIAWTDVINGVSFEDTPGSTT